MKKLTDKIKIKNITFKSRLILAPMAGVSDASFRKMVATFTPQVTLCTEMLSDHAFHYKNPKTKQILRSFDKNILVGQLFGSNINYMVALAQYLDRLPWINIIDINMGCPVPKVAAKAKAGSYWLQDPEKIYNLVHAITSHVKKPVSVKIRSGYSKKNLNYLTVAKAIEKGGASFLTIHPRSKDDGYSGHSDWTIIKEIKENLTIPVVGNGDVKSYQEAKNMLAQTNCDLIMIGRACMGRPFLFKEILYQERGKVFHLSLPKIISLINKHYHYLRKEYCLKIANLKIRTHLLWYLKPYPEAKPFLRVFFKDNDFSNLISSLKKLSANNKK